LVVRLPWPVVIAACAALLVGPGLAVGDKPPPTPGPKAGLPSKAKAYGRYCRNQSKKHVAGTKGTPFSRCVTAMAKLATGESKSPARACKTLSKKHVAGTKGTPYSRCVTAGAKLLENRR
jgi:hypothetical protein